MYISARLPVYDFNVGAFTKTLDDLCQQAIREAAREYYRAVWPILHGAVDTGMAIGSMIPLGRYLRNVPTSFSAHSRPKKGYPSSEYPYGLKSPQAGMSHGKNAEGFFFNQQRGHYEFIHLINVMHYRINEGTVTNARGSAWHTREAGAAAFRQRLVRENLSKKLQRAFRNSIVRSEIEIT